MINLPSIATIHDKMIESLAEIEDIIQSLFNPTMLQTSYTSKACENCNQIADTNLEYTLQTYTGVACSRCFTDFKGDLAKSVKHVHI